MHEIFGDPLRKHEVEMINLLTNQQQEWYKSSIAFVEENLKINKIKIKILQSGL